MENELQILFLDFNAILHNWQPGLFPTALTLFRASSKAYHVQQKTASSRSCLIVLFLIVTQILEIDHYCAEHKMSLEARMDEVGVPHHQYYRWKKKYREEDASGTGPEGGSFVQLTSGGAFVPPMMTPARTSGKSSNKMDGAEASYLTVELRTASGMTMRIQGCLSAALLREIISAG